MNKNTIATNANNTASCSRAGTNPNAAAIIRNTKPTLRLSLNTGLRLSVIGLWLSVVILR